MVIISRKSSARQIRLACAFSAFCWAVYNYVIKGYAGIFTNVVNGTSYLYNAFRKNDQEKQ